MDIKRKKTYAIIGLLTVMTGIVILILVFGVPGLKNGLPETVDYSKNENWAYYGIGSNKKADLFLICPTVDMKKENNMSMKDRKTKASFLGALNMERGIYEDSTRMFAPYYRQAAMQVYELDPAEREKYMEIAYKDVADAFLYYLEHENNGNPIVLAGFSQGADMCYRLLADFFDDEELSDRLVAAYAIGWPISSGMLADNPQIIPAHGRADYGVVVSFDCESEALEGTFINPEGSRSFICINPLNWTTDATKASADENHGACFTDYDGNITKEEPGLCGCYIDTLRGVLKVTDIDPSDYPPVVPGLPEGSYHVYDYQFFFRDLQQNVKLRIDAYRGLLLDN